MKYLVAVLILFYSMFAVSGEKTLYAINPTAFVYHAYNPAKNYTQYFQNQYVAFERRLSPDSDYSLAIGSLKNSFADRCLLLGVRKDWITEGRWIFKGGYAYAGEFFLNTFSHCGDEGVYKNIKDVTGIGFAPYIYHALQYNINKSASVEGGVILPGIVIFSVQLHF